MFWLPHKREEIQTLVFDKTNDINKTNSSRQKKLQIGIPIGGSKPHWRRYPGRRKQQGKFDHKIVH